jgi:hypothetical protein
VEADRIQTHLALVQAALVAAVQVDMETRMEPQELQTQVAAVAVLVLIFLALFYMPQAALVVRVLSSFVIQAPSAVQVELL